MRPARRWPRRAIAYGAVLLIVALSGAVIWLLRDHSPNFVTSVSRQIPGVITLVTYDHKNRELSQGSGFVLTRDGLAASNFHVLQDAYRAEATLGDGRLYHVVRVHGFDVDRDLVVFQLGRSKGGRVERPSGLHALPLGGAAGLRIGDRIATISSPKGLANTVSDGLVSGIRDEDGERLIQISAPISPGSSGGPVFDAEGRVVGIATLQMSEGQNLNFATPIDSLRDMLARRENLTLAEFQKRAKVATGDNDEFDRTFDAGLRLQHRGQYRRAVRDYLAAEVMEPDEPSTYYNAGLCYIELREKERAAEQFYRYLASADNDDPDRGDIEDWLADNGFRVPKRGQ
ncbi:MAG TPA: trypsin-like peptidase domain-containing protein [Candidatus Eisenbacteria bacterium]